MKLTNIAYAALAILILLTGCNKAEKIIISGDYPGELKNSLSITRIEVDIPVFIDSVKINKSGRFKAGFTYDQPAFYNIGLDKNDFITIIAYPGDNISIQFNGDKLKEGYRVEGSSESEDIRMLDIHLASTLGTLDSLAAIFETLPDNEKYIDRRKELEEQYATVINAQRIHNIEYILENLNSFSSIKALYQRLNENAYVLYQPRDAQYLKLVSDTLNAHYPGSKQAVALAQNLQNELNALNLSRISSYATDSNTTDLDLNFMNDSGKRVKLSELEKKYYVLLTFWSAQSRECITNNLQMKEYYKRYHPKGFEIYQVNLDADENLWRQSINYDELPWISVREDDPANPSSVTKYNVSKIPANYLLDKDGEIIGKNLFGRNLQIKLSQLFD